ncbi:MAG: hypothetical protein H6815_13895 [Phycisphaeraceae bacterium]|nr:hypothetical protein [Phycisphaerales bacterium]MCB9861532.1 hypothetical protein [Phycisphaeraceae bacterium]
MAPSETQRSGSFFDRHYFLFRRLHSLSGILPIGVFLIAHLTTNSSLMWGKFASRGEHSELGVLDGGVAYFQKEVSWINEQVPHLFLIETVLWVSILFHAVLGVYYARTGKSNTKRYAYQDNRRYALQRFTGYFAILYIFYHVATLRWGWDFLVPGGTKWSHEFAASTLAMALRGGSDWTLAGMGISLFYFLGITACVYHFANGLWTAAITWGITVSAPAQRRWGMACLGLGVVLMGMAWMSLAGALLLDVNSARHVEQSVGHVSGEPGELVSTKQLNDNFDEIGSMQRETNP